MACGTQKMEVAVPMKHPAKAVWKTYIHELESTLPAIMVGHFDKIEHVEGSPLAPGSVFTITYGEDVSHYEHVKFKWDEIDHDNYTFKARVIDGGALGKHFNHLVYNFKILPNDANPNGCVMHFVLEYEDIGEHTFHGFIREEIEKACTNIEAHISSSA